MNAKIFLGSKMFYKYKGYGYCLFEIDYEEMGITSDEVGGGRFGAGEEEYADNWILELDESEQEDITFHGKAKVEYLLVPEDDPRIKPKCPNFCFKGRIRFYLCEDEPQWRDLVYQEARKERTIKIKKKKIISNEAREAILKARLADNNKPNLSTPPTNLEKIERQQTRYKYEKYKTSLDELKEKIDFTVLSVKKIFEQAKQSNKDLWSIEFSTFRRDVWCKYQKEIDLQKKAGRPRKVTKL